MRPEFDSRDAVILSERAKERDAIPGPRVGDFVRMNGELRRFTHDWGDSIQTTAKGHGYDASFYLGREGHVSFSGTLDPAIPKEKLRETGETLDGSFWFFHHGEVGAHRGVYFKTPCRVFELTEKESQI